MKVLLSVVLLIAGAGLAKADTLETITFNLGDLHPGSTLSATFDVPTSIGTGETLDVTYSFRYSTTPPATRLIRKTFFPRMALRNVHLFRAQPPDNSKTVWPFLTACTLSLP
jgi:hypothetical protein